MAFVVDRLAASQRTRMDQPGLYQIPECRKRVNLRYERFVPTGPLNPNLLALQTSSGGDLPTTDSCTAANNLSIRSPRRRGPVAIVRLPYVTRSWRGVPTAARQRGELDRLSRRAQ